MVMLPFKVTLPGRKCKVLSLGRNSPMHQYLLGVTQPEDNLAEKDLGILLTPS